MISRTCKLLIFISSYLFHLAAFKLVKRTDKSDNVDYFTKCPAKGKLWQSKNVQRNNRMNKCYEVISLVLSFSGTGKLVPLTWTLANAGILFLEFTPPPSSLPISCTIFPKGSTSVLESKNLVKKCIVRSIRDEFLNKRLRPSSRQIP